jgi:hypothetical protein
MSLLSGTPVPVTVPMTFSPGNAVPTVLGFVDLNLTPSNLPSILLTPLQRGAVLYARNKLGSTITVTAYGSETIDGNATFALLTGNQITLVVDAVNGMWRVQCVGPISYP